MASEHNEFAVETATYNYQEFTNGFVTDELSKWTEKSLPADLVSCAETTSVSEVGATVDRRAYTYLLTRCNLLLMPYRNIKTDGELSDHRYVASDIGNNVHV